jgi:hypothetical protein
MPMVPPVLPAWASAGTGEAGNVSRLKAARVTSDAFFTWLLHFRDAGKLMPVTQVGTPAQSATVIVRLLPSPDILMCISHSFLQRSSTAPKRRYSADLS